MAETSSASIEQTYSVILITYNIKYNLLVCPSVRLYPINVKTAEPIRQKFCVGPHMKPEKVCGIWMLKITNFVSNILTFVKILETPLKNPQKFYY